MNRLALRAALTAGIVASFPTFAQSLIGDTLDFNRSYPTPGTPFAGWLVNTRSTTVANGTVDLIDWYANGNSGFHLTVDANASTVTFDLLTASSFLTSGAQFDGFTITGFDRDISFVNVASNDTGLTISLSNGPRHIDIGLNGSNSINAFTLNVGVVPEPQTWALFAGGLLAIASRMRRRNA